jgi:glycerol-3-phosphate acyltransferase PlsY
MSASPRSAGPSDPFEPLRSEGWLTEARRKAIHLASFVLPLDMLFEFAPWPHGRTQWRWFLLFLVGVALTIDAVRVHHRGVGRFFREFFGGMIREHEQFNLLGSTYLLIAALLAVEIFPRPIAAAALGFTVLGDAVAAVVGKAWGRTRVFHKSLEGTAGGLAPCLLWAAFLSARGDLPWEVSLAGALAASLVELLPIPLDDNLGMTLISGYLMKLLWNPA